VAKKEIQVPFDQNDNMLNYVSSGAQYAAPKWKANKPFWTTLVFKAITKGRTAVRGVFTEEGTGRHYYMFLTDLNITVPLLSEGKLEGKFQVRKQGANYGVFLLDSSPLEKLAMQAD